MTEESPSPAPIAPGKESPDMIEEAAPASCRGGLLFSSYPS